MSVVLTVTVNAFSPHATLMSYMYKKIFVHYIKLIPITQALIYVKYRSLSVMNGEWVVM